MFLPLKYADPIFKRLHVLVSLLTQLPVLQHFDARLESSWRMRPLLPLQAAGLSDTFAALSSLLGRRPHLALLLHVPLHGVGIFEFLREGRRRVQSLPDRLGHAKRIFYMMLLDSIGAASTLGRVKSLFAPLS